MAEITVALLIATAVADVGRPTLVLQGKKPVRPSLDGTAVGPAHGQLRVESNAAGSLHVVKLDGTGKPSAYRLVS
jgi:hypothetical protein